MSTNSQTSNPDLPKDGKDVKHEVNSIAQTSSAEATNNTPDDPKACSDNPQETSQDNTDKERTGSSSGNSGNPSSVEEDKESNQQNESSTSSHSVDNESLVTDGENSESLSKNDPNSLHQLSPLHKKIDRILCENAKLRHDTTQMRQEISQMRQEISLLAERLYRLEESAKFKFDQLIKEALKQDDSSWNEDSEECQEYKAQAEFWSYKIEALYTSVLTVITTCGSRIDQCGDLMQDIHQEIPMLYDKLLNRYKSLDLIKQMLNRLREPIELLKKYTFPSEQLLRLQEQDLVDWLRSQTDESEAKKILNQKLKETGDARYKVIREWRDIAKKTQKQWINFIEKKLLPTLDGIDNGKPLAEQLVDELRNSYQTPKLSNWLETYTDVENILLETLKSLDVTQMTVVHDQPINYDHHVPINTEPDPNLPNESIKEITRNGYEYKWEDKWLILRSAQVIVVKNS